MASGAIESVAILSIHPKYAAAILSGLKRVEFRKRKFKGDIRYVAIYASNPVQKIVGFFSISGITEGSPSEVWQQFQHIGGIEKDAYHQYFSGSEKAVAIIIEEVIPLETPLLLKQLSSTLVPPQSFSYMPKHIFGELIEIPNQASYSKT